MARKTRHTDIRVGKADAAAMAEELETRARMAGPSTEPGRILALIADELQNRLAAGWRTRGGLPMTYFRINLAVTPDTGRSTVDLMCG